MTLPITPQAEEYCWEQYFQRLGCRSFVSTKPGMLLEGVKCQYTLPELAQDCGVIIIPCSESAFVRLLHKPVQDLNCISILDVFPSNYPSNRFFQYSYSIPVLFWGEGYEDGSKPFAERREDGTVVFYADIIAAAFFMLTRWEETVSPVRDQHGRFPATASVAYRQGFLDRPIIDEYALILQAWLKTLLPGWDPNPPRFSVKLSHDIDFVRTASLRRVGGDLIRRRNPARAVQTFRQWVNPALDPALQGCYELADLSEQHGFRSAFYFMAAQRSSLDSGYDPCAKPVQQLISDLRQRGHEAGFHPGYQTFANPERFYQEKQRMDAALGESRYGGRQHYLRFQVPETWRLWEEVGLAYDSTVGYADHEGFRCGTCHPFQPFDIARNRPLDLWEIPLIVMDGTLKQYRNLTPEQGEERILILAQRCKAVNGTFTLLWHNTSLYDDWEPWGHMYQRILPKLAQP
ncbi:MAG: polysaccharide deacetylase family protein [Candidatus Caldarchaeum sp.]